MSLVRFQIARHGYPEPLKRWFISEGEGGLCLVWRWLKDRPYICKMIRNRRHCAGTCDWCRRFWFCSIDGHLNVGQLFTVFLFRFVEFSFGRFLALMLQPFTKPENGKQMLAYCPNSRQTFVGCVSELYAYRVDGDDACRLKIVDRSFSSTFAQAG